MEFYRRVVSCEIVGIVPREVESISDDRLFFVEAYAQSTLFRKGSVLRTISPLDQIPDTVELFKTIQPPKLKLPKIDLDNVTTNYYRQRVEILGLVHNDMSFSCQACGEVFERELLWHDWDWMYTSLECGNHPRQAWLDVFPKECQGTEHDWINAFEGFGLNGVFERYRKLKQTITPTFYLTSGGLVKI